MISYASFYLPLITTLAHKKSFKWQRNTTTVTSLSLYVCVNINSIIWARSNDYQNIIYNVVYFMVKFVHSDQTIQLHLSHIHIGSPSRKY